MWSRIWNTTSFLRFLMPTFRPDSIIYSLKDCHVSFIESILSEMSHDELQTYLCIKDIKSGLAEGRVEMTIPDNPHSSFRSLDGRRKGGVLYWASRFFLTLPGKYFCF